jgi:ATP-dependent DNA helicase DinG
MNIPFINFTELWPHQIPVVEYIKNSTARVICLNSPVGSGKSILGMMTKAVRNLDQLTYLCTSRYLQDQLARDFPESVVLKGRANYPCNYNPQLTANECCHDVSYPCEYKDECTYEKEKARALRASYRVLNLQYWLSEANYVGKFSGQQFVVIDEADLLEDILSNFISLPISFNLIKRLGLPMPQYKTKWNSYLQWTKDVEGPIKRMIQGMKIYTETGDINAIQRTARLKRLLQKVALMRTELDDSWLMNESDRGIEFKPLWLSKQLVEKYLLQHSMKFLLMSATLPAKEILCGLFHLDPEEVDYMEVPSVFPVKNRLVYYDPVVDLTRDRMAQEVPILVNKVREIVNKHREERILIHAVSYRLGKAIYEGLNSGRAIIHDSTNKNEKVQEYLNTPNAVIISPSMERGVDFYDDRCRVIIWAKTPYLSLADRFTSQRLYSSQFGKLWYKYEAIHALEQGCGRATRHAQDYSVSYILDRQLDRLMKDAQLFSRGLREALVRV